MIALDTDTFIASVYIHVPFCAHVCDYCDFYSLKINPQNSIIDLYIKKILEHFEIIINKYNITNIPTIYFGGGTPSILGSDRILFLLNSIYKLLTNYSIKKPSEITMEANPEHCDELFLKTIKQAGINRLSIGVQSFNKASRKAVNRAGNTRLLPEKLENINKFFSHNSSNTFSIDLISGLPLQDEKTFIHDIELALYYKPVHVSLYSLTIDPLTALGKRIQAGQLELPSQDKADRLWLLGRELIEQTGLKQYEVSNFCFPGKESLHNLRYWRMENWLGLGPAASSTIINDKTAAGTRITNNASLGRWLKKNQSIEANSITENLDTQALDKETLLMGFRLLNGPDIFLFNKRFGKSIKDIIPKTIKEWQAKGLLLTCKEALDMDRIALTGDGLLLLNSFLVDAFLELEG